MVERKAGVTSTIGSGAFSNRGLGVSLRPSEPTGAPIASRDAFSAVTPSIIE